MHRGLVALLLLTVPLAGCLGATDQASDPEAAGDHVTLPGALIVTEHGPITLVLFPEIAPETVAQFGHLVETGWYNGSTFYRTADNFVIQGGEPEDDEEERDTVPLEAGGYFAAGTVGLARGVEEGSGTSHFFIVEYPQPHLRDPDPLQSPAGVAFGSFTAFGQVVDGMATVRAIAALEHTDEPGSEEPRNPPEMTVFPAEVQLSPEEASWLPLRTWGRQVAPPYRVSLDSPGTLRAGTDLWMRVFVESQTDRGAQTGVDPTVELVDSAGTPVAVSKEEHPADGNVHYVNTTFPAPGQYTLTVSDGPRELASFSLSVRS